MRAPNNAGAIVAWFASLKHGPALAFAQSDEEKTEALRQRLDEAIRDAQQLQDEIAAARADVEKRMAAASESRASVLSKAQALQAGPTQADRPPGCAVVTERVIEAAPALLPGPYLDGAAVLAASGADRQALQKCVAQGDGRSLYLLTLQRAGEAPWRGSVSDRWVFESMLMAGEFGERAGLAAALDMVARYNPRTVWRLFDNKGVERLTALHKRYGVDDAPLRTVAAMAAPPCAVTWFFIRHSLRPSPARSLPRARI